LLLFVDDVAVAAFRQWIGITGEKMPEPAPQITLTPTPGTFDAQPSPMATVTQVETSPNGAQTVTFSNGIQIVEADRPE